MISSVIVIEFGIFKNLLSKEVDSIKFLDEIPKRANFNNGSTHKLTISLLSISSLLEMKSFSISMQTLRRITQLPLDNNSINPFNPFC